MILKKVTLLIINLLLINGFLIFFISDLPFLSIKEFDGSLKNFQLYEDCFNGIDDDGDGLIDQLDEFDC